MGIRYDAHAYEADLTAQAVADPLSDIVRDITRGGEQSMASIIVRGLDDSVKERLAAQARSHGRSLEAEVRDILTRAATGPHIGLALARAARQVGGADDLTVPERGESARAVAFE